MKNIKDDKEDKLLNAILSCEKHNDDMDELLDDFVKYYDKNVWCRGYFKTMIGQLVLRSKR